MIFQTIQGIFVLSVLLVGCSQTNLNLESKQEHDRKAGSDQNPPPAVADQNGDNILVNEPVMTGGAFLTCEAKLTDSDLPQATCALSDGTENITIPSEFEVGFKVSASNERDLTYRIVKIQDRTFWTLELDEAVSEFNIQMIINTGNKELAYDAAMILEFYGVYRSALKTQALHLGDNVLGADVIPVNPETCRPTLMAVSAENLLKELVINLKVHSDTAEVTFNLDGICGIERAAHLSILDEDGQEIQKQLIGVGLNNTAIQMTLNRGSYQVIFGPESKNITDLDDFVLNFFEIQVKGSFLLTP